MSRYYCPYCSPQDQAYKTRTDGVMICSQCGDQLIKVPFFNITKVFALLGLSAFLIPFLLMVFYIVKDLNYQRINNPNEEIVFPIS